MILGNGIRSILRNGGVLLGSNWIEVAIRLVYLVAITRFLTPEDYGTWSYALATYGLAVGLIALGLDALLPIRIGADPKGAGPYVTAALRLRAGSLVVAMLGFAIAAFVFEPPGAIRTALLLSIPALAGRSLAQFAQSIFVGREDVPRYIRIALACRFLEVALGIAALAMGAGILALVALHAAIWALQGVAALVASGGLDRHPGTPVADVFRDGWKLGLSSALLIWMVSAPVVLMRAKGLDLATLGQIALCLQLAAMIVPIGQSFFFAALPILSRSKAAESPRANLYGPVSAGLVIGLTIVGALLALAVGEPFIAAVFGPEYLQAGRLLAPAIVVAGLILAPTGFNQTLTVEGRLWPAIVANAAGAAAVTLAFQPMLTAFGESGVLHAAGLGWIIRLVVVASAATVSRRPVPVR